LRTTTILSLHSSPADRLELGLFQRAELSGRARLKGLADRDGDSDENEKEASDDNEDHVAPGAGHGLNSTRRPAADEDPGPDGDPSSSTRNS